MTAHAHPVLALWEHLSATSGDRPDWQTVEQAVADEVGRVAWGSTDDPFLVIARAASALDAAGLANGWQVLTLAAQRYELCEYRAIRGAA